MSADGNARNELSRKVFDVIPSMIFVVDEDVRIQEFNAAAANFVTGGRDTTLQHRGGEALNCLHSKDVPEGCGRGPLCKNCVIRNSVNDAFRGNSVIRRRTRLEVVRGEDRLEIYALITANPFLFEERPLVLLVIEDISEIAELQRLIPICSVCKKVRDEKQTWSQVDAYFKKHWDVDFSHSFCPECFEKEMEKIKKSGQHLRRFSEQ